MERFNDFQYFYSYCTGTTHYHFECLYSIETKTYFLNSIKIGQCLHSFYFFRKKLGERKYIKIRTVRLQGLVLSVYVKRTRLLSVRDISEDIVRTGLGGLWGNKGAVGLRLVIGGVNICLVNSHLTPHDHQLDARIADYNAIIQQMRFSKQSTDRMILFHE